VKHAHATTYLAAVSHVFMHLFCVCPCAPSLDRTLALKSARLDKPSQRSLPLEKAMTCTAIQGFY